MVNFLNNIYLIVKIKIKNNKIDCLCDFTVLSMWLVRKFIYNYESNL